jgi:hypothetical protein
LTSFSASGFVNSVIASLPQNFDATTRWVEASALVVVKDWCKPTGLNSVNNLVAESPVPSVGGVGKRVGNFAGVSVSDEIYTRKSMTSDEFTIPPKAAKTVVMRVTYAVTERCGQQ